MSYSKEEKEILQEISDTASRYCVLVDDVLEGISFQAEQNDLYTLEEVSKILSLSIVTVRQYVRDGKMKATKHWKNWMVTSNEIARVKYERQHGIKLPEDEVMVALVAGELHEEDSRIEDYRLVTAKDLLEEIKEPSNRVIYRYLDEVFKGFTGPCTYIESVNRITNFFRRTWEVPYSDTIMKQAEVRNLFSETDDGRILEVLEENLTELLKQEPAEAIEFIEKTFGKITNARTVLHIYSLLLYKMERS